MGLEHGRALDTELPTMATNTAKRSASTVAAVDMHGAPQVARPRGLRRRRKIRCAINFCNQMTFVAMFENVSPNRAGSTDLDYDVLRDALLIQVCRKVSHGRTGPVTLLLRSNNGSRARPRLRH